MRVSSVGRSLGQNRPVRNPLVVGTLLDSQGQSQVAASHDCAPRWSSSSGFWANSNARISAATRVFSQAKGFIAGT
jgi:hypothetical protein